ncbi:hypothetical protein HDU76_013536 [Blyttiomyces sp. JEL0837]|nr:hypothetical protein HDU76_013536 [Blyttiomyces sp. JEL0837]
MPRLGNQQNSLPTRPPRFRDRRSSTTSSRKLQNQPVDNVEAFPPNFDNLPDQEMLAIEPYERKGGSPVTLLTSSFENCDRYNESVSLDELNASDGSLEIGYCEEASIQQLSEEPEPTAEEIEVIENLAVLWKKDTAGPETNSDAERIDVVEKPLVEEMEITVNARSPKSVKEKRKTDTTGQDTKSGVERIEAVEGEIIKKSPVTGERTRPSKTSRRLFGEICLNLPKIQPWVKGDPIDNPFRRHWVNKCQEVFEKNERWTHLRFAYQREEVKQHVVGNVGFICELFKLSMLTEKIMHSCIQILLRSAMDHEEEEIELLYRLFSSAGQRLDHTKARAHVDVYFVRIKDLSVEADLSEDLRAKMQELLDLRKNKWKKQRDGMVAVVLFDEGGEYGGLDDLIYIDLNIVEDD